MVARDFRGRARKTEYKPNISWYVQRRKLTIQSRTLIGCSGQATRDSAFSFVFLTESARYRPYEIPASDLHEMSTRVNTDLTTITCGVLIDPYDEPGPSQPSRSTIWRYARSKPTRSDKAAGQQYLTLSEEKAVVEYALCIYERGFPIPVKFHATIAQIIKR